LRYKLLRAGASLALVAGTAWLLHAGGIGADIAAVLTLTLAVFPLLWRIGPADEKELALAAERLAREVRDKESHEQGKLLAESGDAQPADVQFGQPCTAAAIRVVTCGGAPASGSLVWHTARALAYVP
jgi:hypothetical protein